MNETNVIQVPSSTEIQIISGGKKLSLPVNDILFIGRKGLDVVVYTRERHYKTPYSVQELLEQLQVPEFFRVHRSFIVRLSLVTAISRGELWLDTMAIPFSPYYRKHLIRVLAEELNKELRFYAG